MLPYPSGLLCIDLPGFKLETFLPQLPKYWGYKAASAELFVCVFCFSFVEAGSHRVTLAGLVITETCLPSASQVLELKANATRHSVNVCAPTFVDSYTGL